MRSVLALFLKRRNIGACGGEGELLLVDSYAIKQPEKGGQKGNENGKKGNPSSGTSYRAEAEGGCTYRCRFMAFRSNPTELLSQGCGVANKLGNAI